MKTRVALLGATGSIGQSTLDVIRAHSDKLELVAISAHSSGSALAEIAHEFSCPSAVLSDASLNSGELHSLFPSETTLQFGAEALVEAAIAENVDVVIAAIVGAAGLPSSLAAIEHNKRLALANKETMVVAGPIVQQLMEKSESELIPVDSEHSAIFQAMLGGRREEVSRVVLTASGGPFRQTPVEALQQVTPEQALKHPTWSMGPKITIDSATMMNKSLEVIEARWLFQLDPDQIGVVIHPQSIVHSFVEFVDGSVLAQQSPPDMKLPIQYALSYPERWPGISPRIDFSAPFHLDFEVPDEQRFPAIALGMEVMRRGGTCGAVLNACNEIAVERFLEGTVRFVEIAQLCREVLNHHHFDRQPSLSDLIELDRWARKESRLWKPTA